MSKGVIYLFIAIGGTIGGYLPVILFSDSPFGGWSILGATIGSFAGLYIAIKVGNSM